MSIPSALRPAPGAAFEATSAAEASARDESNVILVLPSDADVATPSAAAPATRPRMHGYFVFRPGEGCVFVARRPCPNQAGRQEIVNVLVDVADPTAALSVASASAEAP